MTQNQEYVEAGKVSEINNGHMKHVEINGKEIAIANLDGKFYAFSDRCGHMNARLSRGSINKKVGEPVLELPPGMEPLPPSWQKYMGTVGEEMSFIKTDDQEVFEVKVEGDSIKIKA